MRLSTLKNQASQVFRSIFDENRREDSIYLNKDSNLDMNSHQDLKLDS
jgi:hypothetical protein